MSLTYQLLRVRSLLPGDGKWLIPKLNELYENEGQADRILRFSKYDISCDYALIDTPDLQGKNVKRAIGWGICFPAINPEDSRRILIFKDLIEAEYLDIGIVHEASHLHDKYDEPYYEHEKKAFALELQVAKLARKKLRWLKYNKEEYPWRIEHMKEMGLIR